MDGHVLCQPAVAALEQLAVSQEHTQGFCPRLWYSLCGDKRRRTQQSKEVTFAEVVACAAVQTAATLAVYRVCVGEVTIEVEDDFTDAPLVRLVRAVAQC